jgi:hypothetical protein
MKRSKSTPISAPIVGEAGTEVQWRQSSFAKGEASQQVERDGRETPTTRDASKDRKTKDDHSEFD